MVGDIGGALKSNRGQAGDADPAAIGHLQSCRVAEGGKVSLSPMAQS
jgi:hypothetical protein